MVNSFDVVLLWTRRRLPDQCAPIAAVGVGVRTKMKKMVAQKRRIAERARPAGVAERDTSD